MSSIEQLASELQASGVSGWVVTPLPDVYRKLDACLSGRETFGLTHLLPARPDEILAALSKLTGREYAAKPPKRSDETCWIDPQRTAEQAEAASERLRAACERGQTVMFATGHPAGPLEMYIRLADAMRVRGARVVTFAQGERFAMSGGRAAVRYICGVACVYAAGGLHHAHEAEPMAYLLDTGPRPDLVVGDHGFAGVALARGCDAVALVDTNDPGLVLAAARGLPIWPVMCDDNRLPDDYLPLARFLIDRLDRQIDL